MTTARNPLKFFLKPDGTYQVSEFEPGDQLPQSLLPSSSTIIQIAYDSRNTLRSGTNAEGNLALIESLGLFRFYSVSTEPDDDETCFVQSTNGAWILECPHWDFIDANTLLDESTQDERIEDAESNVIGLQTNVTALQAFSAKFLLATVNSTITSLTALTQSTVTATVTGAAIGDAVIVNPHSNLDPRVSLYGRVSAENTVTIIINNPSASTATLTAGTWRVTVIKP
jgi:hypothetical protein